MTYIQMQQNVQYLLRDFFGREATSLPLPGKGENVTKDRRGALPVVLQGASEEQRKRILTSTKENLDFDVGLLPLCFLLSHFPELQVQQL